MNYLNHYVIIIPTSTLLYDVSLWLWANHVILEFKKKNFWTKCKLSNCLKTADATLLHDLMFHWQRKQIGSPVTVSIKMRKLDSIQIWSWIPTRKCSKKNGLCHTTTIHISWERIFFFTFFISFSNLYLERKHICVCVVDFFYHFFW